MKPALLVKNLSASLGKKEILRSISIEINPCEVHAVMGPNGSGKSTLLYALMGHPAYTVTSKEISLPAGEAGIMNKDIHNLSTEERAKAGLYLALQSPVAIPGVTVMNLLRAAYQEQTGQKKDNQSVRHNPILSKQKAKKGVMTMVEFTSLVKGHAATLGIDPSLLSRGIHDGFSGGEKKKIEMLQALVLKPKVAMFDEIDTGLDVDALKIVARGMEMLALAGTGILVVTHYQRILKYIKPDKVHILVAGSIVRTGTSTLAREIEEQGYGAFTH